MLGAVLVVESKSRREEGPAKTLLQGSKMQQFLNEEALQLKNIHRNRVGDSIQQGCYFK